MLKTFPTLENPKNFSKHSIPRWTAGCSGPGTQLCTKQLAPPLWAANCPLWATWQSSCWALFWVVGNWPQIFLNHLWTLETCYLGPKCDQITHIYPWTTLMAISLISWPIGHSSDDFNSTSCPPSGWVMDIWKTLFKGFWGSRNCTKQL